MRSGRALKKSAHAERDFVMLGADAAGDLAGEFEFAVGRLRVAHRKGLHGCRNHALHEGGNGARIDAAAQEHAERNVAHQPHADGFFQALAALADPFTCRSGLGIAAAARARPNSVQCREWLRRQ